MEKKFELQSAQFFFTDAQTGHTKEEGKEHWFTCIQNIGAEVKEYIIAEEEHKDGGKHLHAWFLLNRKIHIKNCHFMCWAAPPEHQPQDHVNVQGCRSNAAVIKYVTKDGNFISSSSKEELLAKLAAKTSKKSQFYEQVLAKGRITKELLLANPEQLINL